jgi:S1-C subfamily serine protease
MPSVRGQGSDWMSLQRRIVEIYEENRDALVRVKAAYEGLAEQSPPELVIGTGFFISNRGLILTNSSVVDNPNFPRAPSRVWVQHRGVAYSAEVVGADRSSNLALLRLDTLPAEFGFLHLVDSAELPPIGQFLVRLSMPLEFDPTPELGMVAGYESRFGGHFFPCKYIRTTLPSALGDGGSAFIDLSGRLVGLQVASLAEVNSTYFLPSRAALRLRDDFLFSGEVAYGWIGFEVREESSVRDGERLILGEIIPDTPAQRVGLQVDDVLLEIGEYPIRTVDDLRNAMFYTRVGQYVEVKVRRNDEPVEFTVRLDKRPANEPLEVIRPIDPPAGSISPVSERSEVPLSNPLGPVPRLTSHGREDESASARNVPVQRPN